MQETKSDARVEAADGFNYDTLQKVVERALPFVLSGNTSSIKNKNV